MSAAAVVGLAMMAISEVATLLRVEPFWTWNTPIAWTGFIIFADAIVYRVRGSSWIRSSPGEFTFLALVSIPLWLVFEFYNRFIHNWYYTGLSENTAVRYFGYAWSFATIWPAIFEGAELIGVWRGSSGLPGVRIDVSGTSWTHRHWTIDADNRPRIEAISMALGAVMLAWPLVSPSPYLAAPVWLGFIFLLEPINVRLGAQSLAHDFGEGQYDRFKNLLLSGLLCGFLWEFWNYWARAKWHYTVPIMERVKIFEMPLPGYLGFPAFAVECFAMYVFLRALVRLPPRRFAPDRSARALVGAAVLHDREVGL